MVIAAGNGGDQVNVGSTTNLVRGIGKLTVEGGTGTVLTFNDQANANFTTTVNGRTQSFSTSPTYEITGQSVVRSDRQVTSGVRSSDRTVTSTISFANVAQLTINGGSSGNIFNVRSTTQSTTTTVNTGPGGDTVNVGSAANFLDGIQGPLNVNGRGSNTTLNVIDQQATANEVYTIWANSITRSGMAPITYANAKHLVLSGGTGSNTLFVENTAAGTTTDVYGGTGSGTDEFWPDLYSIQGPLHLHGQTSPRGESYAVLYDYFNSNPGTYTLTAGALNRSGMAPLTYDHLVETILYASSVAIATINIQSIALNDVPIVGAGPGDTVTIGQNHSLAQILGRPVISGQVKLVTVDDSADTQTGQQVTFNYDGRAFGISGLAPSRMYFELANGSNLQVLGGSPVQGSSLGNAFTIASLPAFNLSIKGGTGNDTFHAQTQPTSGAILSLNGNGGIDTLIGPDVDETWNITALNAGSVGGVSFTNVENLTGGSGEDVFVFSAGKSISGKIDGGGGTTGSTTRLTRRAVTVNLATNTATGIDGGLAGGIANLRDIRGSQGRNTLTGNSLGNILIGGAGANTIVGGSGPSILIGGTGKATVTGGSGNDIIIAGYTDYDASSLAFDQALDSILAEWQSGNSYTTRISNIKNGGGLNGSNTFVWGVTVHDNSTSSANKLTGAGEPSAQNWFFANLSHTTTNKSDGEQLN